MSHEADNSSDIIPEQDEVVLIGNPAKEIVKEILRKNPKIHSLELCIHPLEDSIDIIGYRLDDDYQELELSREEILAFQGLEEFEHILGVLDDTEIDQEIMERLGRDLDEDWPHAAYVSVKSLVYAPEPRHIPMLDFNCRKTGENLQRILDTLRSNRERGFILDSGHSFHFWGARLVPGNQGAAFLSKYRDNKLVDQKYIELSLSRGFTLLRITQNMARDESIAPRLVAVV